MTIKDIARLSGCGVATVSRVLNGRTGVSEETRQKILAVVAEYNFQPNTNAKHLKQQTSTSIAIVVKGTENMLFADLVEKIQTLLRDSNRDAAVYYLDEDANEVAFSNQLCKERKPLGVLFLGGNLDYFRSDFDPRGVPCVLLTNSAGELEFPNLSSLTTDDAAAAAQVIEYLVQRGHRHIGVVGGNWPSASQISYQRILGCEVGCQRHGLPFDAAMHCQPCRFSLRDAYHAAGVLLDRCPELTALFALSDVMAMGCVRAMHDRGKRVPEDISVVGYDGIAMSDFLVPRLTTIYQDTQCFAERGVSVLLHKIQHPNSPPVHDIVPFRLLEGESVALLGKGIE